MLFVFIMLLYVSLCSVSVASSNSEHLDSRTMALTCKLYQIILPEINKFQSCYKELVLTSALQDQIVDTITMHVDRLGRHECITFFKKYASNYKFDANSKKTIIKRLGGCYIPKSGSNSSFIEY